MIEYADYCTVGVLLSLCKFEEEPLEVFVFIDFPLLFSLKVSSNRTSRK